MGVCAGLVAVIVNLVGAPAVLAPPPHAAAFTLQGAAAPMTNDDVIKMAKAGLAEDVIITAIRQAPRRNFDLTATGLIELKLGKVPDAIVRAMQAIEPPKADPPPAPPPIASPAPPAPADSVAAPPRPAPPTPSVAPPPAVSAPSSAPAAAPMAPQEPGRPGELFAVGSSGGLTTLERVRLREVKNGQSIEYFVDGSASSSVIKAGEPQSFAIRMLGGAGRAGREPSADEAQKHFLLTKLQSADGRRYLTKVDVQFDVRSYGRPTPGLDPRRYERLAQSFLLTPRTPLEPGEYVVYMAGTSNFEFVKNLSAGADRWAFTIADR
jgi:hypothetical protein